MEPHLLYFLYRMFTSPAVRQFRYKDLFCYRENMETLMKLDLCSANRRTEQNTKMKLKKIEANMDLQLADYLKLDLLQCMN